MAQAADPKTAINRVILGFLILWGSCWGAVVAPAATYIATLATFGFTHVWIELRYLNRRFRHRFEAWFTTRLLQGMLLVGLIRCASVFGLIPATLAYPLELTAGLGMVLVATRLLWRRNWHWGLVGIGVGIGLGWGILTDAIATSMVLALLHNLTPVGFILERQRANRAWIGLACGLVFGVMPLLIFLLAQFNATAAIPSNYLRAFVAPVWQQAAIAHPLFSAAVFLQCLHYAAVIGLFSRRTNATPIGGTALKPKNRSFQTGTAWFYGGLMAASLVMLLGFWQSFLATRAIYGIVAAMHAWIEIPLLLLLPLVWLEPQANRVRHEVGQGRQPETSSAGVAGSPGIQTSLDQSDGQLKQQRFLGKVKPGWKLKKQAPEQRMGD
jgi:hypothetical protein